MYWIDTSIDHDPCSSNGQARTRCEAQQPTRHSHIQMFRARLEMKWIILTLLFGWIHLYSKGGAVVNLRYFELPHSSMELFDFNPHTPLCYLEEHWKARADLKQTTPHLRTSF